MPAQKKPSTFFDILLLVLVVGIPLAAIVVYVLNQDGVFDPAPSPAAPVVQEVPAHIPPAPSSAATLTVDDPTTLPTTVTTGEIVPFSFTLRNSGNADATYQYKVSVTWNSGEQDVIDLNSISVAKGASTDVPESLKFETAPSTAKILIQIEPSGPSVSLTLPRTP